MAEVACRELELARPGPKAKEFGPAERARFLELIGLGYGRSHALAECGFGHKRHLARAFAANPEFRDEVAFAEAVVVDRVKYTITRAALEGGDAKAALRFLNMKWKVEAMNEARRARRVAAGLAERELRLKEGPPPDDSDRLDLSALSTEELETFRCLLEKCSRGLPAC